MLERVASSSLAGMTGGFIVVSAYFVVIYAFLSVGCAAGWDAVRLLGVDAVRLTLVIVTLATLLLIGYFGWRSVRAARSQGARWPENPEHSLPRFTAQTAALICGVALVITIWVAAPIFFLAPCR